MRRLLALLSVLGLVGSLTASGVAAAVTAPGPGQANSFVGSFDLVDQGTSHVVGHVVASFKEPTASQLVPGRLDIYWAPDMVTDPYWPTGTPFIARESHGQILRAGFSGDPGSGWTIGVIQGYLCDYITPQNADCHGFRMGFAVNGSTKPYKIGFGTPDWCCDGQWYDVGRGSFVLTYVADTPDFPWQGSTIGSLPVATYEPPPVPRVGQPNRFVGDFDILDQGVVLGHVVTNFTEPTASQLVPGRLDIYWAPGVTTDPYWPSGAPFGARESHGQILRAWFWDDTYAGVGHTRMGRVQGYLCDYVTLQDADCHGFQMVFQAYDNPAIPRAVGFGTFDACCNGQYHNVGKGDFDLSYVGPTLGADFLGSGGPDLYLGGQPFHELSFDKYDLLYQFVQPGGTGWGFDGAAAAIDALRILGQKGYRVVRVATSPYAASWFEDVFFDSDSATQAMKRQRFFAGFDAMLDTADRYGIRIVADLMWNVANLGDLGGHSVLEGMTNQASLGRQRVDEYIQAVVTRYANRSTIAMWELGNEYALGADLQSPPFDYTSDDLVAYYGQTASMIRAIDGNHLIATGDSSPRWCATCLRRAALAGEAPENCSADSAEELTAYLRLINPDPIDVISIHYMDDAMVAAGGALYSPENLRLFARIAGEIGKPLFVGEIGAVGYPLEFTSYNSTQALDMMRATIPVLIELKLPLTLYWTFMNGDPNRDLSLDYGVTAEALRLIDQASRKVRN